MKIICIGRNYSEHAKELNNPIPEAPVFFLKPASALTRNNWPFFYPDFSNDIQYEVEVVFRIGKLGKAIDEAFAMDYIDAVGLGIDFTARDIQQKCKEKGLPWEPAKAFDGSAPVSEFLPIAEIVDPSAIGFHLLKNGEKVQAGNTRDMLFSLPRIISYVSRFMTLKTGDLVFTGTPSGVGPVKPGDVLDGFMGDQRMFSVEVK